MVLLTAETAVMGCFRPSFFLSFTLVNNNHRLVEVTLDFFADPLTVAAEYVWIDSTCMALNEYCIPPCLANFCLEREQVVCH
jgi:hypothetical protein